MTTNRDKFNNLTNEKLAQILARSSDSSVCEYCIYKNRCNRGTISCEDGILRYLKQKKCVFKDKLKYKQALDEIEEIAQDIVNTKEWINCSYNALKAESILDIINKAKERK